MPTLDTLLADPLFAAMLALAAFLVGLSKGGLPGIGMLSVPVLTLVMSPINAAVLLLPIYILSDVMGVWLYRKEHSWGNIKLLIPAGCVGVLVGWATASLVSDEVVALLIGLMGIAFCLNMWLGTGAKSAPANQSLPRGLFWGTLSGFTSFVSHAGAPPYQMYMLPQRLPKMVFAGTTTIVFAAINLAKLIPYASLHPYSRDTLQVALWLVPAAIVGAIGGRLLTKVLSEAKFFLAVQIALFAICLKLVADAF